MFQQVYHHHVRRIYDQHLRQVLRELLPGGQWPLAPETYLDWDDSRVEAAIRDEASARSSSWAMILAERRHFKLIFEEPEGQVQQYLDRGTELARTLRDLFGDQVYVDGQNRPLVRDREMNVRVFGRQGGLSTWITESRIFPILPPLAFFRVYADGREDLMKSVRQSVGEFFR